METSSKELSDNLINFLMRDDIDCDAEYIGSADACVYVPNNSWKNPILIFYASTNKIKLAKAEQIAENGTEINLDDKSLPNRGYISLILRTRFPEFFEKIRKNRKKLKPS